MLTKHVELLSVRERQLHVERTARTLYQEYLSVSQAKRRWDPNLDFDWRAVRQDLPAGVAELVTGFFAVEQYVPDYTNRITELVRRSWGRSSFQLAWGGEEAKHSDLWGNVLLFGGVMDRRQLDEYTDNLRASAWMAPWDTPLHMSIYTVFQERATQYIYAKTLRLIEASENPDPVLMAAFRKIVTDEAAHFRFFSDVARLHLYYMPETTIKAIGDVVRYFVMPATDLYANYAAFVDELTKHDIFSTRIYIREIMPTAMKKLGLSGLSAIKRGVERTKQTPNPDGTFATADILGNDFSVVEDSVRSLFERLTSYELRVGFAPENRIEFLNA